MTSTPGSKHKITAGRKITSPADEQLLSLCAADVKTTLSRVSPHKAAGPDNISGWMLKDCAAHLTRQIQSCHHYPSAKKISAFLSQ